MDEFMQKLLGLRNKVGEVAKGTLQNMGNVREREQEMLDTERARNRELIERNFGTVENYENFLANQASTTPAVAPEQSGGIGDFFSRILGARQNVEKGTRRVAK